MKLISSIKLDHHSVLAVEQCKLRMTQDNLETFSNEAMKVSTNNTILIDQYLENAKVILT